MYTSAAEVETDVLVVGAGPAGAGAAIAARDAGAEVLLAERTGEAGGNCVVSGGFIFGVDGPAAVDHIAALCLGKTPRDVIETYVAGLAELPDWLHATTGRELGPPLPPMDHYPLAHALVAEHAGADRATYRLFDMAAGPRGNGPRLWDGLAEALAARGVTPALGTRVTRLTLDHDGAVTGAELAREAGAGVVVRARGGVVLACGSFEWDAPMREAYLAPPLQPIGRPGNTGDAVRMAQQAGAALWHMSAFFGWFVFRDPAFAAGFPLDFHAPSFVFVDADGRRWSDETGWETHDRVRSVTTYGPRRPNHAHLPLYAIFDEATRCAGPLNGVVPTPNDYAWSEDNAAEIERGWIHRAGDAAGLAAATGLPPDVLTGTLTDYARAVAAGRDPLFNRDPATLVAFAPGPLYAIEMWPGVATASGGPRRDARARVVRPDGAPVPGLYAAGGAGSIWGHVTEHGGGLTDALVFGRVAGAEAAARVREAVAS